MNGKSAITFLIGRIMEFACEKIIQSKNSQYTIYTIGYLLVHMWHATIQNILQVFHCATATGKMSHIFFAVHKEKSYTRKSCSVSSISVMVLSLIFANEDL